MVCHKFFPVIRDTSLNAAEFPFKGKFFTYQKVFKEIIWVRWRRIAQTCDIHRVIV